MKLSSISVLPLLLFTQANFSIHSQQSNIEFVCQKKQMAKNQCHYNFKVDGGKYHFVDVGCRFKQNDVIEKVKEGSFALGSSWKIECSKIGDRKGVGF